MTEWRGDMASVAEQCGDDVAEALCQHLPGILLYVPQVFKGRKPLDKLKVDIVDKLVDQFGGDTIYVPSGKKRKTLEETFEEIEALLDKNLTTQDIALRLGITQVYVFKVRKKMKAPKIAVRVDARQTTMFD